MNDLIRAIFYEIFILFGISNIYRYEHFLSKSDLYYNFEKLKIGLNLPGKEQNKTQTKNWILLFQYINDLLARER